MSELRSFQDQMGRQVTLCFPPRKVISLVPSITEYLLDIDVDVIGRTKFCIHPETLVKEIPEIGGTKKFRFEVIDQLKPDLIIGNKEENYPEGIDRLAEQYPVWMSDVTTIPGSIDMMLRLGEVTDRKSAAETLVCELAQYLPKLRNTRSGNALYLIWKNPWMAAGSKTYIDAFLTHLGYTNVVSDSRYPELSEKELEMLEVDTVLLSSEPFPFRERHIDELRKWLPHTNIHLVGGEVYSWYGSRLLKKCP